MADANTGAAPGVSRTRPHISDDGRGVNHPQLRAPLDPPDWAGGPLATDPLRAWMRRLSDRLRWVRILHGSWTRVCTGGAMNTLSVSRMGQTGSCGVFLDPPYADTAGRADLYSHEDRSVAHDVREWCIEWGDTPWLRIVLAGFEGEHNDPETGEDMLVRAGWRCVQWFAKGYLDGGMGNCKTEGSGTGSQQNRERLWLSPNCLTAGPVAAPVADGLPPSAIPAAALVQCELAGVGGADRGGA